jgi:hypothetical protein
MENSSQEKIFSGKMENSSQKNIFGQNWE